MKKRIMTSCELLSLIVAYLGLFSVTLCQGTCPSRCLCHLSQQPRSVMCTNEGLEVFPEDISDVVEQLNLSNNLLTNITSTINRLEDLQYLNLARNRLSSLPDGLGSLKSLRRLDLSSNQIHEIVDISSVSQIPNLMVLYLSRNPLSNLNGLMNAQLEALDATHCEITQLSNTSLDGLPVLTALSLVGNPLKFIQNVQSPKLRWLDMSDCHLNYLGPDTFSGLAELEELRLSNNPTLAYSTRYTTLRHPKLKKLDVSRCNLDRPGLHGFPSLTHARLSRNMIRLLPDRIFSKNKELGFLYLNSNNIESLNISTFEGLVKLQVLDLSVNSIEEIHPLAFHENVELRTLNLSYNSLYQFPNIMSAVTSLDLSSNIITKLSRNFLANMPKIRSIDLSDNRLQSIPLGLKSTTLKILDLRRNRLVELNNDSFLQLPQLIRIDLSGNRLTQAMDVEIFRNNPDLNTVKLGDNPWRCECKELFVIYSFLTLPPAKASKSNLICQSPANVSGYSWERACYHVWHGPMYFHSNKNWGIVMVCTLTIIVLFGTIISIRHTMRLKRRAFQQRSQFEPLRLLRPPSNQIVEEERIERPPEPRIHPLELIGPPTYEEAVQMPRLARSLDALDEISVEMSTVRVMGSADNLRGKQRRTRRPRKRIQSEDDLFRREERRHERLRRETLNNDSTGNLENVLQSAGQRNSKNVTARRQRRHSTVSEFVDLGSAKIRPRPQTPSAKKRRRRYTVHDGHTTDDEDSDIQPVGSSHSIVIRELRREPKSGYREPKVERDSQ